MKHGTRIIYTFPVFKQLGKEEFLIELPKCGIV